MDNALKNTKTDTKKSSQHVPLIFTKPMFFTRTKPKLKRAGQVYLLRAGGKESLYKIGVTTRPIPARLSQLAPQCPYRLDCAHVIRTDDMLGVEGYWHTRFKGKRLNGEWFALDAKDIELFSRLQSATVDKYGSYAVLEKSEFNNVNCDLPIRKVIEKKMPTATASVKRNPIPAGDHILTLISVSESDQPSFNNPAVMQTRWIWQFKAQQKDPETGDRFEFRIYTGPNYGNVKATLTGLLDMMLPEWADEEKAGIDTDEILNTSYSAVIKHEKTGKNLPDGKPEFKPVLAIIKPYTRPKKEKQETEAAEPAAATASKRAPKPTREEEEDDPDPFGDEA